MRNLATSLVVKVHWEIQSYDPPTQFRIIKGHQKTWTPGSSGIFAGLACQAHDVLPKGSTEFEVLTKIKLKRIGYRFFTWYLLRGIQLQIELMATCDIIYIWRQFWRWTQPERHRWQCWRRNWWRAWRGSSGWVFRPTEATGWCSRTESSERNISTPLNHLIRDFHLMESFGRSISISRNHLLVSSHARSSQ